MTPIANRGLQLLVLALFVVASVASDCEGERTAPGFYPDDVLPSIGNGRIEIPKNGQLFARQKLPFFLSLSARIPRKSAVDAGALEAGFDVVELYPSPVLQTSWLAFDLSSLPLNKPTQLIARQQFGTKTFDRPFILIRTETNDDTPPTFTAPVVVNQYLRSEPEPESGPEPGPAPDDSPSPDPIRPFAKCTLVYSFAINNMRDETQLAFLSLIDSNNGEPKVVKRRRATDGTNRTDTIEVSFSGTEGHIPTGESCYWLELSDLAGNVTRSDATCLFAERVNDC